MRNGPFSAMTHRTCVLTIHNPIHRVQRQPDPSSEVGSYHRTLPTQKSNPVPLAQHLVSVMRKVNYRHKIGKESRTCRMFLDQAEKDACHPNSEWLLMSFFRCGFKKEVEHVGIIRPI